MKVRSATAACAALSAMLLASPASAQAWIGTMVGQISAQRQEALCQANRLPAPGARVEITRKINMTMSKLRAPDATAKDVAKLFSKRKGAKVANTERLITAEDLRLLLGPNGTPGEWKHLVVAADHNSARGVWRSVVPGIDGAPEMVREFGFDFVNEWGAWKVNHAQEYPGPLFAPEPDIYCHAWNTASY